MSELTQTEQAKSVCPKRSWVMSTLTDDERIDPGADMPQALRFHLSRCDSCRLLADRIGLVASVLSSVAEDEPPSDLLALAQARTRGAIERGGVLTGRVDVFSLEEVGDDIRGRNQGMWRPFRFAAAAIILIGVASIWIASQSQPARPLVSGPDTWNPAIPAPVEVAENSASDVKPAQDAPSVGRDSAAPELVASDELGRRRSEPRFPRPTCRHSSLIEAASCDNPNCVHRIRERPGKRPTTLGWEGMFQTRFDEDNDTRLLGHNVPPKR